MKYFVQMIQNYRENLVTRNIVECHCGKRHRAGSKAHLKCVGLVYNQQSLIQAEYAARMEVQRNSVIVDRVIDDFNTRFPEMLKKKKSKWKVKFELWKCNGRTKKRRK